MHIRNRLSKKTQHLCRMDCRGKFKLISQQEFLVESLEVLMDGPMIYNKQGITVPGRRLAVIKVSIEMDETMDGQMFEVKPNFLLTN